MAIVVAGGVALSVILQFVSVLRDLGIRLRWEWLLFAGFGAFVAFLGDAARKSWAKGGPGRTSVLWAIGGGTVLLFLGYPPAFSEHGYTDVPQSIGGGEAVDARLLLSPEGHDAFASAGFMDRNATPLLDVRLVLGTPGDVLFLLDAKPVSLDRDMVAAILLPEEGSA